MLEGISEFIFMLLLLLLAKGYTVTRGRLRVASAIKLTLFNCLYIVIYALLFLFEQYVSKLVFMFFPWNYSFQTNLKICYDNNFLIADVWPWSCSLHLWIPCWIWYSGAANCWMVHVRLCDIFYIEALSRKIFVLFAVLWNLFLVVSKAVHIMNYLFLRKFKKNRFNSK